VLLGEDADALRAVEEDAVLQEQRLALGHHLQRPREDRPDLRLDLLGGREGRAADAEERVREPRAGLLLAGLPDPLAGLEEPEKRGEGPELHGHGAVAGEVVADARHLAEDHPEELALARHLDPEELLHREGVAHVVEQRRHVVEPVGVREHLRPGASLGHLLEGPVEVPRLDVHVLHGLAVQLQDHPDGAVHRGVRRTHEQGHGLARKFEVSLFEVEVYGLHESVGSRRLRGLEGKG
jgi:hypothetical protein